MNTREATPVVHSLRRLVTLLTLTALTSGMSCQRAVRSGALIDAYRRAECVVPVVAAGIQPPTRGWDTTIALSNGAKATIQGAEKIAGKIVVRYEPDGPVDTAAAPGDYIYPSDVRHDRARGRLYVKARGLAGGVSDETWLYEYDLDDRKPLRRQRVHPDALPAECEITKLRRREVNPAPSHIKPASASRCARRSCSVQRSGARLSRWRRRARRSDAAAPPG